jgi:Flp pilus assembly protein TadB
VLVANTVLSLAFAIGVTLIFLEIYSYAAISIEGRRRSALFDPEADLRPDREHSPTVLERLDRMLYEARFTIRAHEFLLTSAIIGGMIGLGMFVVTLSLLPTVLGFLAGAGILYLILLNRRETSVEKYEQALPTSLIRMQHHLNMFGGDIVGALQFLSEKGPRETRSDFGRLASAFSTSPPSWKQINDLLALRGSYSLDRVVEALYQNLDTPQKLPEALDAIVPDLKKETLIRNESRAVVSGQMKQLTFVSVFSFVLPIFMAIMSPGYYGAFYRSPIGSTIWGLSFFIIVGNYIWTRKRVAEKVSLVEYHRSVPEGQRILLDQDLEGLA